MRYTIKAHGEYLGYLIRTYYFRALLAGYAFLVFFGVMPKAPTRAPWESEFSYMFGTVSRSLAGFAVLAVLLMIVCAAWAAIAAMKGLKPPAPAVPDETADGGPL